MGVDFLGKFIQLKTAYERERGMSPSTGKRSSVTGQPLVPAAKGVPKTTWADTALVFSHLKKIAEPSLTDCFEMLQRGQVSNCNPGSPAFNFVRTASFEKAKAAFDNMNPYMRAASKAGSPGNLVAGVNYVINHPRETFPANEEFWGYANSYVIARSAAGEVPAWTNIAIESIGHSLANAPGVVKDALATTLENIPDVIPNVSTLFTVVKWTAIVGSAGLVYWYILRPLQKQLASAGSHP